MKKTCAPCKLKRRFAPKAQYDYYFCLECINNGKKIGGGFEKGVHEVSHYLNKICDMCARRKNVCPMCLNHMI